ncbi:DUF11 domain-containing protein, partial [bacterium]|nr:DUF11 domain-containing protein [bacterium]
YSSREEAVPGQRPYLEIQTTSPLGLADLAVSKSVDMNTPAVGDSVQFSVSVTNNSIFGASGVNLQDPLPLGLTYAASGLTQGTYDSKSGQWTVGSLGFGQSAQLNIVAVVDSTSSGRTITNWAWSPDASGQDGNASNDADSASVVVLAASGADVGLAMAVNDSTPSTGQDVTFTVDLSNTGPDTATNVVVALPLPAGITAGLGTPDAGTWDGGAEVWTVPSLAMGGAAQLVLGATIDLGTEGDSLTVSTTVTRVDQTDANADNDKAAVRLVVQSADLDVTTVANNGAPSVGDSVTLATLLRNLGPTDATGVILTDALPAGLTATGYTVSAGSYDSTTATWTVGSLPVGSPDSLFVTATVDSAAAGDSLTYSSSVTAADQPDPDPANDSDSVVMAVPGADLEIVRVAVDDANPAEGDTIRFTVDVRNNGPTGATGVGVSDVIPAGLTYGADAPSQGTYDSGTGSWTIGGVAAGDSVSLTLDVTVDPGTAGDTITSTAVMAGSSPVDPDAANDSSSVDVVVQGADLQVTNTVSNPIPNEGDTVIFTVTLRNLGPNTATGVALSDSLPAGLTYVSAAPSIGSYNSSTGLWSAGDLAPGAIETLATMATVDAGTGGSVITTTATATLTSPADPDSANDSADASVDVQSADLSIAKTVSNATPSPGGTITYTIEVVNAGPDSATAVAVADSLPGDTTYLNSTADQGTYSPVTHQWTIGTIAAADTVTLSLVATVNLGTAGHTFWNHADVAAVDQADPSPGADSDSVLVTVSSVIPVESADLVVDKTVDDVNPGVADSVTFTVALSNGGPDPASSVKVTDSLPAGLTYASHTVTTGNYNDGNGEWNVGAMANAQAETLTVTATVDGSAAGRTITNSASVTSSSVIDLVPGNSSDTAVLLVRNADLSVVKSIDDPAPNEGDTVTYTVTARNAGPDSTSGVQITDALPAGLSFLSATPSIGAYVDSTGIWSIGAMAAGDSALLSLSATVDGGTGGATITNTAAVTASAEGDSVAADNAAAADLTVRLADLGVSLAVDDPAPSEGDSVTFTISLNNAGPDSATGVTVTDLLPAGLTFQSAAAFFGNYDVPTGAWTLAAVAPGDTLTLDLRGLVDTGTNGTTIWDHAAVTASDVADDNASNDADSVRIDVPAIAGVGVALAQSASAQQPGATAIGFASVALSNSTPAGRTLTSIAFDNVTVGPGSVNERDAELGTVTLYRDDGDFVFEPQRDTPLAQATFSGGRAVFSGLSVSLPSSVILGLHVGGSVSLAARDGDV